MAYIWDRYSTEKRFIVTSVGTSPYLEVWDAVESVVPVNIDIRLFPLLVPGEFIGAEEKLNELLDLYENDDRYQDIVNTVIHFIAQQDRNRGMTLQDFRMLHIYQEIMDGYYGAEAEECFSGLTRRDKIILCRYMAKYDMSKGREMQLDAALMALFDEVNIYLEKSSNIIRIYIHKDKNDYHVRLFWLTCWFLKDIDVKVEVYWKHEHFGVIGVDETMRIDQIALL